MSDDPIEPVGEEITDPRLVELSSLAGALLTTAENYGFDEGELRELMQQTAHSIADVVVRLSESPGAAPKLVYPDTLNDELRDILGRPNFLCAPFAHLFRAAGRWPDLPRKAEEEQARVIDWMLRLYLEHGDTWRKVAAEEIAAAKQDSR